MFSKIGGPPSVDHEFRVWCPHGRGPSSGCGTRAGIEGKECCILHLDPI